MASPPPDSPFPASGSLVGPWIVGKCLGSGSYGRVFHAVHKDRPEAGPYALKVACRAADERFEREAHLLSRIHHPSVPRFEDSGTWTSPEGEDYPYLVMEWVEGLSLYSWALEHGLTLRQAIGQLAQVARALQATHLHGVHRDVKGGNVRVSPEGKAVLLDFGSCWYPEASPLTGSAMPPGTDNYRSPQQLMHALALEMGWQGPYDNSQADDLYALGVTAYRLLAGGYPPRLPDNEDGSQKPVRLKAPRGLERACPELGELIERLLAEDPLERGSAQQIAEELEALLEYARPALDAPWIADPTRQPTAKTEPPAPPKRVLPPVPRKPESPPAAPKPVPPPEPRRPALPPEPKPLELNVVHSPLPPGEGRGEGFAQPAGSGSPQQAAEDQYGCLTGSFEARQPSPQPSPGGRGSLPLRSDEVDNIDVQGLREPGPSPVPQEPAPPPKPRAPVWRQVVLGSALASSGLAVVLLCVLLARNAPHEEVASTEPESEQQEAEKPDTGTSVGEEGLASVAPAETPPGYEGGITRELPDHPLPGQKLPPCNQRAVVVINGGCWRLLGGVEDTTPCDPGSEYEYGGRCYVPLMNNAVRVPTSNEPP